jgi:hypothetical protein
MRLTIWKRVGFQFQIQGTYPSDREAENEEEALDSFAQGEGYLHFKSYCRKMGMSLDDFRIQVISNMSKIGEVEVKRQKESSIEEATFIRSIRFEE